MKTLNTKIQFRKWTLILLVYTVLVILWGAWVRISHSGDGCGDTWPLCNGQLIPEAQRGKTWVEFGHRLMSGLYGILVAFIWFKARQYFHKSDFTRKAAFATFIFMIIEALLGAKLVLFKLVTTNATPYRAFVMSLHQVNSFLLTGAIALTYFSTLTYNNPHQNSQKDKWNLTLPFIIVLIGVTGAWAALSNSLFPSQNLWDGLLEDFSAESHFLVRLRILHPLFAILGAGSLALYFWLKGQSMEDEGKQKPAINLALLLVFGILFGMGTLFFHAPTWMKISHLAFAHIIWVFLLKWVYLTQLNPNLCSLKD